MDQFAKLTSSTVIPQEDNRFLVKDLDTAIYIYMRSLAQRNLGIRAEDAIKVGPAKHHVIFSGSAETARQLEVDFANDPCVMFAAAQRSLKRMIRRLSPDERAQPGRSKQRD